MYECQSDTTDLYKAALTPFLEQMTGCYQAQREDEAISEFS